VPLVDWQSSVQAPGTNAAVVARLSLDPATNELTYQVTAAGFPEGEILAATIHRAVNGENGPVIAVLSNHAFQSIAGTEKLSDPDREKLFSGGLYLRIAARSKGADNMRIPLKAPNPK
jgi:hypothetical protein